MVAVEWKGLARKVEMALNRDLEGGLCFCWLSSGRAEKIEGGIVFVVLVL